MNDTELDRMVAGQMRVRDEDVAGWDLDGVDVALRERIVAGAAADAAAGAVVGGVVGGAAGAAAGWRGVLGRRPARLLVAAAVATVLAGGLLVASPFGGGHGERAYAAAVLARAERSPRLLVEAKGWTVTYVDERDRLNGETHFSDGRREAQAVWYPADQLDGYVADRQASYGPPDRVTFLGRPASLFVRDAKRTELEVVGLLDAERMVDLRVPADVLDDVRVVDPQQWLDALPDSTFDGLRRAAAIDDMLVGVPLPPGYDPTSLKELGLVSDRYQLGAAVVQSVGCVWFDRWFDAKESGDMATADEVSRVLRTSHRWPVLLQMDDEGDYPEVFWESADATATGELSGGEDRTFSRANVSQGLGCTL